MRRIYGRIIEGTGWTYPVIDSMTLADFEELFLHWSEEPPLALVIKNHLGYKAPSRSHKRKSAHVSTAPKAVTQQTFDQILAGLNLETARFGRAR